MCMKKRDVNDLIKLHQILHHSFFEEQYQDVLSFVRALTDNSSNPNDLTAGNIEHWNRKFDEVLGQLALKSSKEDNDQMKWGEYEEK